MSTKSVIDLWKTQKSHDWAYYDKAESDGGSAFWTPGSIWRERFDRLDLAATLEIACGMGRHAAHCVDRCGKLYLVDTSIDAIASVRERFANRPNVHVFLSEDGLTLPMIPDASLTAAFSYDAMVHFEVEAMASYLRELGRTLVPGGMALIHHSNNDRQPTASVTESIGWRNYMTADLVAHLAARGGLELVEHQVVEWSTPTSDALSVFRRK